MFSKQNNSLRKMSFIYIFANIFTILLDRGFCIESITVVHASAKLIHDDENEKSQQSLTVITGKVSIHGPL